MSTTRRPRAVIVGAGFAGLWAAKTLAANHMDVIIVDRFNYHTFLPLLYQVAAAEIEPEQIAHPIRGVFRHNQNIDFIMTEVTGVDYDRRVILTTGRPVFYDYLLLAPGSVTRFFNTPGAAEHAFRLKTLDEGVQLRNQILTCFERSLESEDPGTRERLLTFVIVGGGPTGVEYAGALAELIRGPLARDFRDLGRPRAPRIQVCLLEASDSLLRGFPEPLRAYAARRLSSMGVSVMLGAKVERITPHAAHLQEGLVIPTETVVWTAGVKGAPLAPSWQLPLAGDGRAKTLPTLQHPDHPEVFVAGDICLPGKPLPMIAPVAMQQGRHAARNMLRLAKGKTAEPFAYRDKGSMATIGRGAAVSVLAGKGFTGLPAWLLWLFIHLLYLVGFRNRLLVLVNWSINYFLFEKAIRIIMPSCLTGPPKPVPPDGEEIRPRT